MKYTLAILLAMAAVAGGQTKTVGPNGEGINASAFKGNLSLSKSDVGLSNVDNTSDASKAASGPLKTALDGKMENSNAAVVEAIEVDPAAILEAAGAAESNALTSPFSVVAYGADPTGATDSSAAILTAATAAAAGNHRLHFPRGTYKANVTFSASLGALFITGDGAGTTGDWSAVETPGATLIKPNSNGSPVFLFEMLKGVRIEDLEIRGNGAGVSTKGVLIDAPAAAFAGNGLYLYNVTIRAFSVGLDSQGGCNINVKNCGIFNCNYQIQDHALGLAHSYTFDQCSLGGSATVLGGSGTSRILDVTNGSFFTFLNCEMGNCTDMIRSYDTNEVPGAGVPVINFVGGNIEGVSSNPMNQLNGGTFNMRGCRIATAGQVLLRAGNQYGTVQGVSIQDNLCSGANTLLQQYNFPYYQIRSNGIADHTVATYSNNGFTTLWGTGKTRLSQVMARRTTTQSIGSATTTTVVFDTETSDLCGVYDNSTGILSIGKQCRLRITSKVALSDGTNMALTVWQGTTGINTQTAVLGRSITGGSGTVLEGSAIISLAPYDKVTVRLISSGAVDILAPDGQTSTVTFEEIPFYE